MKKTRGRLSMAGWFWLTYIVVLLAVVFCLITRSGAASMHQHRESFYQDLWCVRHGGISEWRLADNTRCDCLTATHAVEVDFAPKFYEAIGQALYYSLQTGRRAGIVLIVERPAHRKYFIRLNSVIDHFNLPIDTWQVGGQEK